MSSVLWYFLCVALLNLALGFALALLRGRGLVTVPLGAAAASPSLRRPPPPAPPRRKEEPPADAETSEKGVPPVATLLGLLDQYQRRVMVLDEQLRQLTEDASRPAVEECLRAFTNANGEFSKSRETLVKDFDQQHQERSDLASLCDNVHEVTAQQAERVEETQQAINDFDFQSDLRQGCGELVAQNNRLLQVNHQLRDQLSVALAATAGVDPKAGSLGQAERDELTGLLTWAGTERVLAAMRQQPGEKPAQLTLVITDLDQFARVNSEFGVSVGDEVLRVMTALLKAECEGSTEAARIGGQRFLLLIPGANAQQGIQAAERIRQSLEQIEFQRNQSVLKLTASCAVAPGLLEEPLSALLSRLEGALVQAKRYGRNRTFLHEGEYPTPVVPPDLAIEPRSVSL